jgi:hypothetical protein
MFNIPLFFLQCTDRSKWIAGKSGSHFGAIEACKANLATFSGLFTIDSMCGEGTRLKMWNAT